MVTFQAGRLALLTAMAGLVAACSGEQQDWRSAESADTSEAWDRFLEQHPDSELAGQARARLTQLEARRDWQLSDRIGTMEAYRAYLARHPTGRWSEQARIRIEGFSLGSAPRIAPPTAEELAASQSAGVRALRLASATTLVASPAEARPDALAAAPSETPVPAAEAASGEPTVVSGTLAQPGEAAQPSDAAQAVTTGDARADDTALRAIGYGVQLGAFGTQASADREWQRLQDRFGSQLNGLSPRIVLASTGSGEVYRLQVAASGEAQARALCDSLKGQAQACVPVVAR